MVDDLLVFWGGKTRVIGGEQTSKLVTRPDVTVNARIYIIELHIANLI